MTTTNERALRRLLRAPLVKWPTMAAKLDGSTQMEIARALESDAERAVLLSEYLESLSYGAGHTAAQRLAARKVKRVRKALGYTYPDQGLAAVSW